MPVLLALLLTAVLTAAFWVAPLLTRPTLPFGVRIPESHDDALEILAVQRRHGHRVLALGAIAAATQLGLWLWLVWTPAAELLIPVLAAVYVLCGLLAAREVKEFKRTVDFSEHTRRVITADLTFRTNPVPLPWRWLLPAALLTATTATIALLGDHPLLPATTQLLITLGLLLITTGILRARPDIDPERPISSARRYRVYLAGISRLLLLAATGINAVLLVNALQHWGILAPTWVITAFAYLPLAGVAFEWILFTVRVGEAGHRLPAEAGEEAPGPVRRDDDRYWHLAGMVYANRRDPAVLVHRRVGMFWTLNLGHPVAWTVLGVVGLLAVLASAGVIELPRRG